MACVGSNGLSSLVHGTFGFVFGDARKALIIFNTTGMNESVIWIYMKLKFKAFIAYGIVIAVAFNYQTVVGVVTHIVMIAVDAVGQMIAPIMGGFK